MKNGMVQYLWGPLLLVLSLGLGGAAAQTHCSQLPPLTPTTEFPRCSERQLTAVGFPDHMHAQHWSTWQVLQDAAGVPYGPGSLCERGRTLLANEELVSEPGEAHYRQFVIKYNPEFPPCNAIGFVELVDWANHIVPELLGLATDDTLTMLNPDSSRHYTEQSGQGVWRLYKLDGNTAIIEPFHVLVARTLDGHAAFMLVTDWILQRALPRPLPLWLHQGLVEYMGEDGTHLRNYMAQFRAGGPILFSGPLVNGILARGVVADEAADREMYRRACYSAYLMVWQLVENEGGLTALQDFLGRVADGADPDEASLAVYGMELDQLAVLLDPVRNGEPGGKNMAVQAPSREP